MTDEKKKVLSYIDEKADVIIDTSDKIWDFAELSLREFKSGELYAQVLKEEGFEVEHPFCGIETAFRASYGSGKPVIGILAEYDALTGLSQDSRAVKSWYPTATATAAATIFWEPDPWRLPLPSSTIWRKRERGAER